MGLFTYYAKWIICFSNKIKQLKNTSNFPLSEDTLQDFESLKNDIANASFSAINENLPFIIEYDVSNVVLSETLNQAGRLVAFMFRTLQLGEHHFPATEKEATAIIETVRKLKHFLSCHHFTLVTDQRSVALMFNNQK